MTTKRAMPMSRPAARRRPVRDAAAPMRLSYLIGQLDRVVSRRLTETLAGHGLTLAQFTVLSVLRARGRSSNAQLAERSLITPQSANEVVKVMEANGIVMRMSDPTNRRVVLLQLTDEGEALLDRCDEAVDRVEALMLEDIPAERADALRTLLHACVRNLRMA